MRALTMDEVGFVSGGGTPLAQQKEQAAYDAMQRALDAMGLNGDRIMCGYASLPASGSCGGSASMPNTGQAAAGIASGAIMRGIVGEVSAAFGAAAGGVGALLGVICYYLAEQGFNASVNYIREGGEDRSDGAMWVRAMQLAGGA
jgi:hypothetical protein